MSEKDYYSQSLTLGYENKNFRGEFCASPIPLLKLKQIAPKFLHPEELRYFQTLSFERRQQSYLLGRFVAKHAISQYLNTQKLNEILIDYGVFNHPIIYPAYQDKIQVSYSHSDQLGLAIVYPEIFSIGVDIESIAVEKKAVIATQLTQQEKNLLTTLQIPEEIAHIVLWSIKEALSKALRTGMLSSFEIYEVKNLFTEENYWRGEFKNFYQYESISFSLGQFICSIVYPKKISFAIDIADIQSWIKSSGC